MQNSTWGLSQLTGLETLLYGINQSLTDEDATMVFQGLGMYVTSAAPPIDPTTGEVTNWNIGPQQSDYVPGCWLHTGRNTVTVFDLDDEHDPQISGKTAHVYAVRQ